MMKITRNDATVGVFLLLALIGTIGFFVAKAGRQGWLRGTKRFTIKTVDGRNIKEQAPVRMSGIQIGVVESIDMDEDARIAIRFRVDPAFGPNVKKDARATIIEPPVIGLTFVDIFPGSIGAEEAPRTAEMPLDEAPSLVATVEGGIRKVESILRRADAALEKASTSIDTVNRIAKDLAEGDGFAQRMIRDQQMANDLKKIVANASLVSDDLVDASGAIKRREGALGRILSSDALVVESEKLLGQARASLTNLDGVTRDLTANAQLITKRLDATAASVEGLRDVIENAKKLTAELTTLTANINKGKGTVGQFMTDESLFTESKALHKEHRETVQDLREQAPINSFIGVVFSAF